MILAVVDTNVLVSGLLSASGNEALLLVSVSYGLVSPCFSQRMLDEYREVLNRPKFAFAPENVAALLQLLKTQGRLIEPPPAPFSSPDPTDNAFLDCAHASKADFIVTGNKRHFPLPLYGRTRVVNAAQLLEGLASNI